jgi:hypothetical protein
MSTFAGSGAELPDFFLRQLTKMGKMFTKLPQNIPHGYKNLPCCRKI